jgi:hypothetical protein
MKKSHHKDPTHTAVIGIVAVVAIIGLVLLLVNLAPPEQRVGQAGRILQQKTAYSDSSSTEIALDADIAKVRAIESEIVEVDYTLSKEIGALADDILLIKKQGVTADVRQRLAVRQRNLIQIDGFTNRPGYQGILNALQQLQKQQRNNPAAAAVATGKLTNLLAFWWWDEKSPLCKDEPMEPLKVVSGSFPGNCEESLGIAEAIAHTFPRSAGGGAYVDNQPYLLDEIPHATYVDRVFDGTDLISAAERSLCDLAVKEVEDARNKCRAICIKENAPTQCTSNPLSVSTDNIIVGCEATTTGHRHTCTIKEELKCDCEPST